MSTELATTAADTMSVSSSEAPKHQPVRGVINLCYDFASSNPVTKIGVNLVQNLTPTWVSSTVTALGTPIVDTVDSKISGVITTLHDRIVIPSRQLHARLDTNNDGKVSMSEAAVGVRNFVVESSWVTTVDAIYTARKAQVTAQVKGLSTSFATLASETWLSLDSNGDGKVSKEDFINGVKSRLKGMWSDQLVAPSEAYFAQASAKFASLRAELGSSLMGKSAAALEALEKVKKQLGSVWEEQVVAVFTSKLAAPAMTVFRAAGKYLEEHTVKDASDFIAGMRDYLGAFWVDSLEAPLKVWLEGARTAMEREVERLHAAVDWDSNGVISIGDFALAGKYAVSASQDAFDRLVVSRWRSLLTATQYAFDRLLPGDSSSTLVADDGKTTAVTITSLSTHVSDRLVSKGKVVLGGVRDLSSGRLKNLIHVDLIAYGQEVIDKAQASTKPALEYVYDHLKQALVALSSGVETVTEKLKKAVPTERFAALTKPVEDSIAPVVNTLTTNLSKAVERARSLAQSSNSFLYSRQLTKLPRDVAHLLCLIPSMLVSSSAQAYPDTAADSKTDSKTSTDGSADSVDLDAIDPAYGDVVGDVRGLVDAIKAVFFWSSQAEDNSPTILTNKAEF